MSRDIPVLWNLLLQNSAAEALDFVILGRRRLWVLCGQASGAWANSHVPSLRGGWAGGTDHSVVELAQVCSSGYR